MKNIPLKASVLLLTATLVTAAFGAEGFQTDFATTEITPPAGWRRAGSYTELVSTGVHDPLMVRRAGILGS